MFHQKVRQLHLESRFLTKFDSSSGVLYFSRCHFALHPIYKACSRPECVGTFLHCNFFARPSTWESLWIPLRTLVGHVFAVNERDWIILLLRGTLKQSRNYLKNVPKWQFWQFLGDLSCKLACYQPQSSIEISWNLPQLSNIFVPCCCPV